MRNAKLVRSMTIPTLELVLLHVQMMENEAYSTGHPTLWGGEEDGSSDIAFSLNLNNMAEWKSVECVTIGSVMGQGLKVTTTEV